MRDVLVLCYHAVSASWPAPLVVRPDRFEAQMKMLASRGYVGATFTQALDAPPGRRTVAVTFDDAYVSVIERAAPVLERLGWPATVYVPTDWIGRDEPMRWPGIDHWADGGHAAEMRCMDWAQLRVLRARGWEIGSHTCSHPFLPDVPAEQLRRELSLSREVLEEGFGERCRSIAYPYGGVDARVADAAARAGYESAAGLPERAPRRADRMQWPRLGVYVDDTDARVARRTRPAWRALERSAAWPALRSAASAPARMRPQPLVDGYMPLLGERAWIARARPGAVASALAGLAGWRAVQAAWPSPFIPQLVVPPASAAAAAWMARFAGDRHTLARRRPALWSALRARGALVVRRPEEGLAARALAQARTAPARAPVALAVYSATSHTHPKKIAFVWEDDGAEPTAVVKLSGVPSMDERLRREVAVLGAIRGRCGADPWVSAALPAPPLWAGDLDGRFVVVEPVEALGGARARPGLRVASEWLRRFHAVTALPAAPWSAAEHEHALRAIAVAWERGGLGDPAEVCARVDGALAPWRDRPFARHAVHGDYWSGNLAGGGDGASMRVFDWEWAAESGRSVIDLVALALDGAASIDLGRCLAQVEAGLRERGEPEALALALLVPSLAELAVRWWVLAGQVSGLERTLLAVLPTAAARLPPA